MFKVELIFDTEHYEPKRIEELCRQTDHLFEREDLACVEDRFGRRTYLDKGRDEDFGRFWAALFAMKRTMGTSEECIRNAYWYHDDSKEDLLTEFIRD